MKNIIKINFNKKIETPNLDRMMCFLSQSQEVQNGMLYLSIQETEKRLDKLERILPHLQIK